MKKILLLLTCITLLGGSINIDQVKAAEKKSNQETTNDTNLFMMMIVS